MRFGKQKKRIESRRKKSGPKEQARRDRTAKVVRLARKGYDHSYIGELFGVTKARIGQILDKEREKKAAFERRLRFSKNIGKTLKVTKGFAARTRQLITRGLEGQAVSLRLKRKMATDEIAKMLKVDHLTVKKWLLEAERTYPEDTALELERIRRTILETRDVKGPQGLEEWKTRERGPDKNINRLHQIYNQTLAQHGGLPKGKLERMLAESEKKIASLQGDLQEKEVMRRNALRVILAERERA